MADETSTFLIYRRQLILSEVLSLVGLLIISLALIGLGLGLFSFEPMTLGKRLLIGIALICGGVVAKTLGLCVWRLVLGHPILIVTSENLKVSSVFSRERRSVDLRDFGPVWPGPSRKTMTVGSRRTHYALHAVPISGEGEALEVPLFALKNTEDEAEELAKNINALRGVSYTSHRETEMGKIETEMNTITRKYMNRYVAIVYVVFWGLPLLFVLFR